MNTHTVIGIKTLEVKRDKQRAQKTPHGAGFGYWVGSRSDSFGSGAPALRALPPVLLGNAAGVIVPQHGGTAPRFGSAGVGKVPLPQRLHPIEQGAVVQSAPVVTCPPHDSAPSGSVRGRSSPFWNSAAIIRAESFALASAPVTLWSLGVADRPPVISQTRHALHCSRSSG